MQSDSTREEVEEEVSSGREGMTSGLAKGEVGRRRRKVG